MIIKWVIVYISPSDERHNILDNNETKTPVEDTPAEDQIEVTKIGKEKKKKVPLEPLQLEFF